MTGPAANKARTEAAQIITRLQFSGMTRASIAKQLGVSADTIKDIARGKSSGDAHLMALRSLHNFNPAKPATGAPTPGDSPAETAQLPTQAITPSVDVEEAPQEPERSAGQKLKDGLKDAILGKGAAPLISSKQAKGAGAANGELVEQLVPTLALLLVILSTAATPARYAACDPTHAEAAAMLTPIVRIMTRQMDAAGKLTETQMDLLQVLMACGVYGQRAFTTYREIQKREDAHAPGARNTESSSSAAPLVDARASGPVAARQPQHPAPAPAARQQPASAGRNGHSTDEAGKPNPFADIYQLDALGRQQLGIN